MWQPYSKNPDVVGNIKIKTQVYSSQLNNDRDIVVYLPPSYDTHDTQRYPVLYMQDGQNIFDAATSFVGEWHVDATMETLSDEGIEAIVVGIPNLADDRMQEYNPYDHPYFGKGKGDLYLEFLLDTIKPDIDASFRTLPDQANTGLAGSSMGGHISLYALFKYPDVFGMVGAFSPAFWVARRHLADFVIAAPTPPARIYIDTGTEEMKPPRPGMITRKYTSETRIMTKLLVQKGYKPNVDLMYIEEEGGKHNEEDWARRFPNAMRFLFKGEVNLPEK